ncbi:MAG: type I methionyl aminopeptidase [Patescibacteria group bacterium]|nr:type I methionyl aminopeptidase [Patescibacteria group bacterium]MCL5095552.1 type I methionyl aminopeptidase [Patescibacteria group bacterium]
MISLKTKEEMEIMKKGGQILAGVMEKVKRNVRPGVSTLELDRLADKLISQKGEPSFKKVRDYKWASCMCVNDIVVHGIPGDYKLKEGDLLGIDIGMLYQGFHSDMAQTVIVGEQKEKNKLKFLKTGQKALEKAINQALVGKHIGHLSAIIQETVEKEGYSSVRALTGHGIGKNLHEEPAIPCFLEDKVEKTPKLKEGMTLAVEIIYNQGKAQVVYRNDDGWTIQTEDGKLSGLFEDTIAITAKGPIVLTQTS